MEKLTLKGTLEQRRLPIIQAVRENRFDDADHDLVALQNEFDSNSDVDKKACR